MELRAIELELNMQTLFDAHLHLDRSVLIRFSAGVGHNELFFLRYLVIITVDHHVYEVPKADYYAVVAFKLFFNSIELEVILHIVSETSGWLKISDYTQEL